MKKDTSTVKQVQYVDKYPEIRAEYIAWSGMLRRCYTVTNKVYSYYGERGIRVCESWHTFKNFLADMGPRPSTKHSLDRIDVNGNYEPANCRWATKKEQANNRRSSALITANSKTMTAAMWSEYLGINQRNIYNWIHRYGKEGATKKVEKLCEKLL